MTARKGKLVTQRRGGWRKAEVRVLSAQQENALYWVQRFADHLPNGNCLNAIARKGYIRATKERFHDDAPAGDGWREGPASYVKHDGEWTWRCRFYRITQAGVLAQEAQEAWHASNGRAPVRLTGTLPERRGK